MPGIEELQNRLIDIVNDLRTRPHCVDENGKPLIPSTVDDLGVWAHQTSVLADTPGVTQDAFVALWIANRNGAVAALGDVDPLDLPAMHASLLTHRYFTAIWIYWFGKQLVNQPAPCA